MTSLQLKISSAELSHKGKVALIHDFLQRCSGQKTTYSFSIADNGITISPVFKTQEAFDRVETAIWDILNDLCEELDGRGRGCSEHYNCCDCGGHNCGCSGCFSCNACNHCLDD